MALMENCHDKVIEMNNYTFHRIIFNMQFTSHYNVLDGIEPSSTICHPMKKFGVPMTILHPMLISPLLPKDINPNTHHIELLLHSQSSILSTKERDNYCSSSLNNLILSTKQPTYSQTWPRTSLFHSLSLSLRKLCFFAKIKLGEPTH